MIDLTNGLQESGHGLLNISNQVDINTVDNVITHIKKHPCIVFDLHGIGVFLLNSTCFTKKQRTLRV